MKIWNLIKHAIQNYIKKLEKSNQEVFGSSTPDCCSLNRQQGNQIRR